jgi:opacity protein-like surface antigen
MLVGLAAAPAVAAQGLGLGARMSMIRNDVDADTGATRFTGGHIRVKMSPKTAIELALDLHSETNEERTERIREYPVQASLLLFPVRAAIAPYLLGGGGWYTTRIDTLADEETVSTESSRKFGWHGGFGAELRFGRHAAAHADYRYTFLDFGDDDETGSAAAAGDEGVSRFLPSHKGSMWTAGLTVYF